MNQNITFVKKEYKCFNCGARITFAKGSKQRYNLNGTVHVCASTDDAAGRQARQEYSQSKTGKTRGQRYWGWYWGYGPGKYHKDNERRYSGDAYQQRREEARQRYNEYRSKYESKDMTKQKACEILGIDVSVLTKRFDEAYKIIRAAYAKLALRFHPDRNKEDGARQKFEEATTAFELLVEKKY